jgi:heme-degrading monooxygenase HmoA
MSIARIWKGLVREADAAAYLDYVRETGIRDYRATEGNLGAFLLKRETADGIEVATLTLWDSLDAIKRFAGEDYARARYYPEDDRYLVEKPAEVVHYDIVEEALGSRQ